MVIASIDPDSQTDKYHTDVAQFQHAVCHHHSVRRQHFAPASFFFVAADAYNQLFCEFFDVGNVNTFLALIQMKITSFSNCFEQLSLAWQFASVSSLAGVS